MKLIAKALAVSAAAIVLVALLPDSSWAGGRRHHYGHRWHGHNHGGIHFGFSFGTPYYSPYYYRPYYYPYYYPPSVVYVQPPVQYVQPPVQYAPVQNVPSVPPGVQAGATDRADCLMVREYQTQITIDGKLVDAYGDACLQPDGSWRRGPPKVAQ